MKKLIVTLLIFLLVLPIHSFASASDLEVFFNGPSDVLEPNEVFNLSFRVKNNSINTLEGIESSLILPKDTDFILNDGDSYFSYSLGPCEEKTLTFSLKVYSNPTGVGEVSLETLYTPPSDPDTCPTTEKIEIITNATLSVNVPQDTDDDDYWYDDTGGGGGNWEGSGSSMKNKPKLIISEYSFKPQMPKAGQEFTMTLTFLNTNTEKSCRNIKIFLTTDAAVEGEGGGGGGGVFSPVGSSNTFYIGYIAPGESAKKTITFYTVPTATSKSYTMTANFEYEDYEGTELTAKELIGIPVVQDSKIQVDEPNISSMGPGMPVMLDINFYNTGRDQLSNFMVSVEGEGISGDQMRYFVGNFPSGSSDSFSTNMYINNPGEFQGKVLITYEDSTGTAHSVEKEFTGYQEEMPPFNPDEMFPGEMNEQRPFYSNPYYIGGALLLAALAGIVFKKRNDKKKAKDLLIDEDQ